MKVIILDQVLDQLRAAPKRDAIRRAGDATGLFVCVNVAWLVLRR